MAFVAALARELRCSLGLLAVRQERPGNVEKNDFKLTSKMTRGFGIVSALAWNCHVVAQEKSFLVTIARK